MKTFDLSRNFWNWAFDNPDKISPNHAAIYFFAVEHCNRLGDKEKFGFPTMMVCDAIGIKKASTYIKYFNDLVEWGFFHLIERSSNQYSANIISLTSALPKKGEALDKAMLNHRDKQTDSIGKSKRPVDKQLNHLTTKPLDIPAFEDFQSYAVSKEPRINKRDLKFKYESWVENGWKNGNGRKIKNWKTSLLNTIPHMQTEKAKLI